MNQSQGVHLHTLKYTLLSMHNTHISNTPSQPKQTIQRLTQAEIQAMCEKGLRFYHEKGACCL